MIDPSSSNPLGRRSFLRTLAGIGAGAAMVSACGGPAARASGAGVTALGPLDQRIGLQLYTIRDLLQQDFEGTLATVAQVGYDEVEFAGYYQRTPDQVRALLDELGLAAPSSHVGMGPLRQDLDAQVRTARTVGHEYLTVPAHRVSGDDPVGGWRAAAAEFNTIASRLREEGLRFAYHNHAWELQPLPGETTALDILIRETDPDLVDFQLDLYWAHHAGRDPLQLFRQYPGRFTMWHVKDMRDPDGARQMVPVGQGEIDFGEIFRNAAQSGMRHFFVEHDDAADTVGSLVSIETSYRHLRQLLG